MTSYSSCSTTSAFNRQLRAMTWRSTSGSRRLSPSRCDSRYSKNVAVEDHSVLDDFRQSRPVVPVGQSVERGRIDEDAERLMEGADEVFTLRMVDADLSADRAVDVGQERRGHLDEGDAAGVGGGREAGRVSHDAAPHGHDDGTPVGLDFDQRVVQAGDNGQRLRLLARLQIDPPRLPAGPAQTFGRDLGVRPRNMAVADDQCFPRGRGGLSPTPRPPGAERISPTVQTPRRDQNLVAAGPAPRRRGHNQRTKSRRMLSRSELSGCNSNRRIELGGIENRVTTILTAVNGRRQSARTGRQARAFFGSRREFNHEGHKGREVKARSGLRQIRQFFRQAGSGLPSRSFCFVAFVIVAVHAGWLTASLDSRNHPRTLILPQVLEMR